MGFICRMRTLLSRATQLDPSFNVGVGLVAIIAAAEIFAVTSYYLGRIRPAGTQPQTAPPAVPRPAAPPVSTPATAPLETKTAPSPEAVVQKPAPSLSDQLLREATKLRNVGVT